MSTFIILKTGHTYPSISKTFGDFEHWIQAGIDVGTMPIQISDPRTDDMFPEMDKVAGVVVTGSRSMVTDREPWSEASALWLRHLVENDVPVLGICYGHQLLAHAMGGDVEYHSHGIEIGTVTVKCTEFAVTDELFQGLPAEIQVHAVHRQSVRRLPPNAVLLAGNEFEPHHAYRIGRSAWGVQFHPEFSPDVMTAYIRQLANDLAQGGKCVDGLLNEVNETVWASLILHRFGEIIFSRNASEA
ncbi:glutamine amidotransferase [Oxalobacteraceae bacterium R-40]|uniref:Glutamine amidotransferase n=1 Tax=Keguizhuia sedimenti TaxID=3064264 RepID=A0ABU1BQ75_9BURK|nr:glutamine amidotransferase [Oxalobacteraceae bacterium R-40]